jgi:hypothetical protein
MHGRNHRPKGWYGTDDPGGSDPLNWLNRDAAAGDYEALAFSIPGLDAYFPLDEESGNTFAPTKGRIVAENLANRNLTRVVTANTLTHAVDEIGPVTHKAVRFNHQAAQSGTGPDYDYMNYAGGVLDASADKFPLYATTDHSICFWIRPRQHTPLLTGTGGIADCVFNVSGTNQGWRITLNSSTTSGFHNLLIWEKGNPLGQVVTPFGLENDVSYFVICECETTGGSTPHTMRLFINTVEVDDKTDAGAHSLTTSDSQFRVGVQHAILPTVTWTFGKFDLSPLFFYNRVLTSDEKNLLWAGGAVADGAGRWFNGSGDPVGDLGAVNDFYLDTASSDVWLKGPLGWTVVGSL